MHLVREVDEQGAELRIVFHDEDQAAHVLRHELRCRGIGVIPAETIQAAHVATLGFEFCRVVSTADLV